MNNITPGDLIDQSADRLGREIDGLIMAYSDPGEVGFEVEELLKDFLNKHLPQRFKAVSGYIIDCNNTVSPQIDVIIYDALNSAPHKVDSKNYYIANDHVVCVVETTYRLDKAKIIKDRDTIIQIKQLSKRPPSPVDHASNRDGFVSNKTHGLIYAFSTPRTIETLTKNWADIHNDTNCQLEPDFIFIHNTGMIGRFGKERLSPIMGFDPGPLRTVESRCNIVLARKMYGGRTFFYFLNMIIALIERFPPIPQLPGNFLSDDECRVFRDVNY